MVKIPTATDGRAPTTSMNEMEKEKGKRKGIKRGEERRSQFRV
jgi:hypothetical protein